jgi:tagaturonate reductase
MNYTQKLKARALPVLLQYVEKFKQVPEHFSTSFAAYLLFMKVVKQQDEKCFGSFNGKDYLVNDEKAPYFMNCWNRMEPAALVRHVLQDTDLWDSDLTLLPGFEQEVAEKLMMMMNEGMLVTLQAKKVLQ